MAFWAAQGLSRRSEQTLRRNLLHLLPNWPASAGLSWGNLPGLRQQHRTTYRKMLLQSCAQPCSGQRECEASI